MTNKIVAAVAGIVISAGAVLAGVIYSPTETFPISLTAPTTIAVGEMAVFDVSETGADSYAYSVTPPAVCHTFEGNTKLVFSSTTPGTFVFVVAAAKGGQVSIAEHSLTVEGGDPDPSPGPASFSTRLKKAIAEIEDQEKESHLAALSGNLRAVASMIAAGVITTAEDAIVASYNLNTESLGAAAPAWLPVRRLIADELNARAEAGSLSTLPEHSAAWREIADLLEGK